MTQASSPAVPAPKRGRDMLAAFIVLALGAPLVFLFARAIADGEMRRRETPLRAILGDASFEALSRGEKTQVHYLGDGLLAPDFTLRDKQGKPWRLSDHRGKVVVMNFWTVTCQPCVEEMPSLVTLADIASRRDDIEVVAITTDKDWAAIAPIFPPASKLQVLFDADKQVVGGKFGTRLFPETWIIGPDGVVRMRIDGPRDWGSALSLEAITLFKS